MTTNRATGRPAYCYFFYFTAFDEQSGDGG